MALCALAIVKLSITIPERIDVLHESHLAHD
jgi:hypothetical protein